MVEGIVKDKMNLAAGDTLLFVGDSITDCGRELPLGQGEALGDGYVALVDASLAATRPETPVRILNTGVSGNRVTDLEARWDDDVLAHEPDWLSVMIGINDVWRQFDRPLELPQVSLERFESVYRSLLRRTRPRLKGLVLMGPYFIEANREDPLRRLMDEYGGAVARLAGEFDARFIDVQAAFDAYLEHRSSHTLCSDRVHPNRTGHMLIARAFLDGTGS